MRRIKTDDIDHLFDYGVYLPQRLIVLGPEVDWEGVTAEYFLKGMALLQAHSDTDPIIILLNNYGGEVYHGLAMHDAIATSECHVTAKVFGHAMSMGSWILQAADKRVLAPNATLMLHTGSVEISSPAKQREWDRLSTMMEKTYLHRIQKKRPRFTLSELRKRLEVDWYLSAEEAVSFGLADEVMI